MKTIFWIKNDSDCRLAIVARPDGDGLLEEELAHMHAAGIQILVSMLESQEERELGLSVEAHEARALGMDFVRFPIADRQLADNDDNFRHFISELVQRVRSGA